MTQHRHFAATHFLECSFNQLDLKLHNMEPSDNFFWLINDDYNGHKSFCFKNNEKKLKVLIPWYTGSTVSNPWSTLLKNISSETNEVNFSFVFCYLLKYSYKYLTALLHH